MRFRNRTESGRLLAEKLKSYKNKNVVIYAIPRGGVLTAVEVAKTLHAPLELLFTRKISHPNIPEYAIAATTEGGLVLRNRDEIDRIDEDWLNAEIAKERKEATRRRLLYGEGRRRISLENNSAIVIDDGIATGLTLRVGIQSLKQQKPKELIVAVPVIPESTADIMRDEADRLVALEIPPTHRFLGSVGAYYEDFSQVDDEEVITILTNYQKWLDEDDARLYGEPYAKDFLQ